MLCLASLRAKDNVQRLRHLEKSEIETERDSILKDLGCRLIPKLLSQLWYNFHISLAVPTVIVGVNSDFVDLVSSRDREVIWRGKQ